MGFWSRRVYELAEDFGLRRPVPADEPYLTQAQAARYCCVSIRQFRKLAPSCGLFPFVWMGRLVYRKDDLLKAMEAAAWQQSTAVG